MSLLLEALKRAALEKSRGHKLATEETPSAANSVAPSAPVEVELVVPAGVIAGISSDAVEAVEGNSGNTVMADRDGIGFGDWPIDDDDIEITESVEGELDFVDSIDSFMQAEMSSAGEDDHAVLSSEAKVGEFTLVDQGGEGAALGRDKTIHQQAVLPSKDDGAHEIEESRKAREALRKKEDKRAKEKAALEQLLAKDKTIARKGRRRARFLYSMLFITALGGILSYYLYLLMNRDVLHLQDVLAANIEREAASQAEDLADFDSIVEPDSPSTAKAVDGLVDQPLPPQPPIQKQQAGVLQQSAATQVSGIIASAVSKPASSDGQGTISGSSLSAGSASAEPRLTNRTDSAPQADDYIHRFTNLAPIKLGTPAQDRKKVESLMVRHQTAIAGVSDLVQQDFSAFNLGHYDEARMSYDLALQNAPADRNALLGAAAVAVEQGRYPQAMRLYQEILQTTPGDRYARAAILAATEKAGGGESVAAEIRRLLAEDPESAYLHFLNGVQLAAGQRWANAQKAFFEALYRDPENADYMYNLAVSLDHLNQATQAQRYYQQALARSELQTVRFSRQALKVRLAELAGSPQ